MLLCNGCQFFEELGEEDGSKDFRPVQRDGFGFWWRRTLQDPPRLPEGSEPALV